MIPAAICILRALMKSGMNQGIFIGSLLRCTCLFAVIGLIHSPSFIAAADITLPPKVSFQLESSVLVEGRPIVIIVNVVHSYDQKISISNIFLDEPVIEIKQIGEEVLNPENLYKDDIQEAPVVTRFRVILPPKPSGIYTLGPVHVQLGAYTFDSPSITINVQSPIISPALRLSARMLNQHSTVYPGQTVTFEYRITYTSPLRLTKEDLPLLRPQGFLTVGSPKVLQERDGSSYVQVIHQEAKALTSGIFDLGSSSVEGMRVINTGVKKELIPPLYRAEAPSVVVRVEAFPIQGRPSSFYGAIGSYAWRSRLLGPDTVSIGATIEVEYRVSGRGDLTTVQFPPKEAFFGIEESFIIEKWPDDGREIENTKTFIVRLKARRPGKALIPGATIASFDPASAKYLLSTVLPLSIEVIGAEGERASEKNTSLVYLSDIEIMPIAIAPKDLRIHVWTEWDLVYCMVFAILALSFQWAIQRYYRLQSHKRNGRRYSRQIFEAAVMKRSHHLESLVLFRRAFFIRLYEVELGDTVYERAQDIPQGVPVAEEVRALIEDIDRFLYEGGPRDRHEFDRIYSDSVSLYHKLKGLPTIRYATYDKEGGRKTKYV